MILCPQCGASASAADRFCGDCGAGLPPRAAPSGGMGAAQAEPMRVAAAAAGAAEASSTAHAEFAPARADESAGEDEIETNAEGDVPAVPDDAPPVAAGREALAPTPEEAPRAVKTGEEFGN